MQLVLRKRQARQPEVESVMFGSSGHERLGKRSRSVASSTDRWTGGSSLRPIPPFAPGWVTGHTRLGSETRRMLTMNARLHSAGHSRCGCLAGSQPAESFPWLVQPKLRQLRPRQLQEQARASLQWTAGRHRVAQTASRHAAAPDNDPELDRPFGPAANLCFVRILGKVMCPFRNVFPLGM